MRKRRRELDMARFNNIDSKKLWRTLTDVGVVVDKGGIVNHNPEDLNNFFISAQKHPQSLPFTSRDDFDSSNFTFANISNYDLYKAVFCTKSNTIGHDGIPMLFIKLIYSFIQPFLLHLFNTIITTSCFPTSWKIARIVPIPKDANNENIVNHRPISILPGLSKALEKILKDQVTKFILDNKLISDCHSGYRNGFSTTTLLTALTDTVRNACNANKCSVLVSLDLSKAFDTIDYNLLTHKLHNKYKFSSSACKMIFCRMW